MTDKLNHPYTLYVELRRRAGWDADLGMVESVWNRMGDEGRQSAIEQYTVMANNHEAELAAHGQVWGEF